MLLPRETLGNICPWILKRRDIMCKAVIQRKSPLWSSWEQLNRNDRCSDPQWRMNWTSLSLINTRMVIREGKIVIRDKLCVYLYVYDSHPNTNTCWVPCIYLFVSCFSHGDQKCQVLSSLWEHLVWWIKEGK